MEVAQLVGENWALFLSSFSEYRKAFGMWSKDIKGWGTSADAQVACHPIV